METGYIISNSGELVAVVNTELKSGAEVRYSFDSCDEALDANREKNLANAHWGKISFAKKYEKQAKEFHITANMINPGEFLLREI